MDAEVVRADEPGVGSVIFHLLKPRTLSPTSSSSERSVAQGDHPFQAHDDRTPSAPRSTPPRRKLIQLSTGAPSAAAHLVEHLNVVVIGSAVACPPQAGPPILASPDHRYDPRAARSPSSRSPLVPLKDESNRRPPKRYQLEQHIAPSRGLSYNNATESTMSRPRGALLRSFVASGVNTSTISSSSV